MGTIPVGSGLATQFVVKDEATYGVAPSLTSGVDSFEITSDTLELKKTTVTGEGLAAGHVYQRTRRRVLTNYDVSGAVPLNLPTRNLGFFLRYMIGDFTETPAQIGATGIYKTVFTPKSGMAPNHSFTIQKGVPAVDATVLPFTYVGCKVMSWDMSVAVGQIASLNLNIDARNELAGADTHGDPLNASVPALATFATPTNGLGTSVFHFREATLFSGGTPTAGPPVTLSGATALGNVKDASITQAFGYDNERIFIGTSGFKAEPIENAYRSITGSFTIEWLSSHAIYDAFADDTTTSLQLTFTGPTVSTSNYLLDIIIPNIKIEGESPKVPGPGVVTQSVPFSGYDDETTTPIQVTYQSEDVTF